jgi:hypothetical protein
VAVNNTNTHNSDARFAARAVLCGAASLLPLAAFAADGPAIAGIPVEFLLFAATLLGVALFHHHTLNVAPDRADRDHALQAHLYRFRRG